MKYPEVDSAHIKRLAAVMVSRGELYSRVQVRKMVRELHAACPDGGYICCASDHFFSGDPENIRAFVKACAECKYQ